MDFNTKHQNIFENLESWASDDLQVLQEFGAEDFSTPQLMDIRGQLKERINWLERRQRTLLGVVLAAIGWAALGFFAYFLDFKIITGIAFSLFTIAVIVYIGGMYYLKIRNSTSSNLQALAEEVEAELKRRRMMSIKGL